MVWVQFHRPVSWYSNVKKLPTCACDILLGGESHVELFLVSELTSRGALRCVTGRSGARKCFFSGP